jgi:predicted Zn-dependent protease
MLEAAHASAPNWHSALQLALMAMAAQDRDSAQRLFSESYSGQVNPFACYGLAVLADLDGDKEACARYCDELLSCIEADNSVLRDIGRLYLRSNAYSQLFNALNGSAYLNTDGRLRLFMAQALCALGRLEEAEEQLVGNNGITVDDLREGELILSSLYYEIQRKKAERDGLPYDESAVQLPAFLNFRLKGEE